MGVYLIQANVRVDTERSICRFSSGKVVSAENAVEAKKKFEHSFVGGELVNVEYTNFYKIEG